MASKTLALSFFLCLNLIFFTLVSSNYVPCPPPPPSGHGGHHSGGPPGGPTTPTPPGSPMIPTPPTPSKGGQCPIDILKLQVCGNVLNGLLNVVLGAPPKSDCCPLLQGLTDLDAAICLCTAIEADVLGIHLDVPVSLSVLLNYCGKAGAPSGFQCPSTPKTPSPATPTPVTPTPKTPTTPTPTTPTTPTPTPATPTPVTPTPTTPTTPTPTPTPTTPTTPTPTTPTTPTPTTPTTPTPTPTPTPTTPTTPTPTTPTTPTPAPSKGGKCPTNILKLQVCGNVLNGLLNVVLGAPPKSECCSLLQGLTDLDAAICLCTAIEADVLGIHLDVPVSLSVLLNYCGKAGVPSDFQCPSSPTTPTPTPATPTPTTPTPTPATPTPTSPTPTPATPTPSTPTPTTPATPTTPTPSMGGKCPTNILKLQVCGNVLNGLLNIVLGGPPKSECCSLLQGLTDLDAAICLCTAIKADVLGIHLDVPVSLSVLLNYCGKAGAPSGFQCPA